MASVSLRNVTKVYTSGIYAVRDTTFDVADGELVVVVGPSGCGKTTTLRMIAGLEKVTAGEIAIASRSVNKVRPGARDVAMVFQSDALYPHMSVRQNMAFGLTVRRTPRAEIDRRVAESAKLLSIESLLDRRPRELSGGQRQRVAVGRAIVRQPTVFLFDEPLSNLDAQLRSQMRGEFAALHQRLGTTTIYVTHDQVEAMTIGNRLVVMKDGVVQQVGTPLDVYRRPANRFVATFIGSPAMNMFEGGVEGGVFRTPGDATWRVDGAPDGPVVLGVRPEDLLPATDGEPVFISARPRLVEDLGHERLVYFDVRGATQVARLPSDLAHGIDVALPLTIRRGCCHLFVADEAGVAIEIAT